MIFIHQVGIVMDPPNKFQMAGRCHCQNRSRVYIYIVLQAKMVIIVLTRQTNSIHSNAYWLRPLLVPSCWQVDACQQLLLLLEPSL